MNKLFVLTLCVLINISLLKAQGVTLLSNDAYNSLPQRSILGGAGELDERHVMDENLFPTPGDQGRYWNCVGWAVGYALHSYYEGKVKNNLPDTGSNVFSFAYIYDVLRQCDNCKCGIQISQALQYLKHSGNVPLPIYPSPCNNISTDPSRSTELKNVAIHYKINEFYPLSTANLNEIKAQLLNDIPVIVCIGSTDAFRDFKNKTENDTYTDENMDGCLMHAVLIIGYDNGRKAFKIINSYGSNWGHSGFGWISYNAFRKMSDKAANQGFVIQKDYNNLIAGAPDSSLLISPENFHPYSYKEKIKKERYSFTSGFYIDDNVLQKVTKITYTYDDPSFTNRFITTYKKPNFETNYLGWECLDTLKAKVYFSDGSTLPVTFNSCQLIEKPITILTDSAKKANISALVSIEYIKQGVYDFKIQLRGIDGIRNDIREVEYDRNHPSFKQRLQIIKTKENNFEGGYRGWGCLSHVFVTIYFNDNTTKVLDVNMCKELGMY